MKPPDSPRLAIPRRQAAGRWKLLAIVMVCAAPLMASYFTYYVIRPEQRTNYGDLFDPQAYPMPKLGATWLDGGAASLDAWKGKWIMLQVNNADCPENCRKKLYDMRQLRTAQGKQRERIERVWLITDDQPLEAALIREYEGTRMLRVNPQAIRDWLQAAQGASASDHIYLIDPSGHLMMRFPKDADPNRIKKDLVKLLKASGIG